jgi:hypothetical protein
MGNRFGTDVAAGASAILHTTGWANAGDAVGDVARENVGDPLARTAR